MAAQHRADEQRQRPKTPILVADPTLCAHVTARLEVKDSPMTISRELASGVHGVTGSLSRESTYRGIYAHGKRGLPKGLHERLTAPA
jgi:IS30 family transposase